MSMPAGGQKRRVSIRRRVPGAVDALNQPLIGAWETVFGQLWARPLTQTGMAAIRASNESIPVVPTRYSWRIRFRPVGIDEGMQLVHMGQAFDIVQLRHDFQDRRWTDLICELGASDG